MRKPRPRRRRTGRVAIFCAIRTVRGISPRSLGDSQNAVLSGNLDYAKGFKRRPFTLTFGGGYSWNIAGTSFGDGLFREFLVSQGIVGRQWSIQVSDDISYLKEAPVVGFSGVPGTGEPISGTNPTPPPTQTIFTLNTRSVNNTVNGEYEHNLNFATALSVGGGSELMRYPDGNGLDTNAQMANAGLTRRLNARSSLSGQYSFTEFSYPGNNLAQPISSFVTNAAFFGYQRVWNRSITTNVSAGPEWLASSNSAVVPSSTSVAGNASASDQFRFGSASLELQPSSQWRRGISGRRRGQYRLRRLRERIRKKAERYLTGGYMRTSGLANQGTSGLANQGDYDSKFGAAMATLRLSRYFTSICELHRDPTSRRHLPLQAMPLAAFGKWPASALDIRLGKSTLTNRILRSRMLGHRELTMQDYFGILKRRFWLILISAILFLGVGIGGSPSSSRPSTCRSRLCLSSGRRFRKTTCSLSKPRISVRAWHRCGKRS